MGVAVSFALQPLFSWRKFSGRHFIGGRVNQKADLENTDESEVSVASMEIQTTHFGGIFLRRRRGIRNNNTGVGAKSSNDSSCYTLH
jgi:hypothetical protein